MEARIAYFVMAHRRPEQLRWLIEAIADPRDLILLHIDLKSLVGLRSDRAGMWATARSLARRYPNVRLMRPRPTNWGGWSLARLQLEAVDLALDTAYDWTHFINLSGQCYPIKPMITIRETLQKAPDQVFVELRHFASLPPDDWHLRWHPTIELPHKSLKLRGPRRPPERFELQHKGSQWSILPRSFCEWQRRAPVGREIRRYLRHLLLSDELIVQTLLRNGPWREHAAPHYGREIIWPGPKVFAMDDWDRLMASPALFARKFDPERDADIVPALARKLGYAKAPTHETAASALEQA